MTKLYTALAILLASTLPSFADEPVTKWQWGCEWQQADNGNYWFKTDGGCKHYLALGYSTMADYITDLEARLAAAEAKAKRWEESSNKMTEFYEHRGKLLEGVNAKLAAAEAGEDALAEALSFYGDPSGWNQPPVKVLEGLFTTAYENQASKIRSDRGKVALAAYEARRKG